MFRLRAEEEMKTASVYANDMEGKKHECDWASERKNATNPNSSLIEIWSTVEFLPFGSGVSWFNCSTAMVML